MRVTREDILGRTLAGRLVLNSFGPGPEAYARIEAIGERGYADVVLTIDGVEFDYAATLADWEKCIDSSIEQAAREMVEQRAQQLDRQLANFSEQLKQQLEDALDGLFPNSKRDGEEH